MKHRVTRLLTGIAAIMLLTTFLGGCILFFPDWLGGATDITIALEWDDRDEDLELYLTFPVDDGASGDIGSADIVAYADITDAFAAPALMYNASHPENDSGNQREIVDDGNRIGGAGSVVTYSAPSDTARIIEVDDLPASYDSTVFNVDTIPSTGNALNADFGGSDRLQWLGVMEVYVLASSGEIRDAGDPELSIYDSNDNLIAKFPLDENAGIRGMSVVRIPFFRADPAVGGDFNYYQYLIDKQLILDTSDIRSAGETDDYLVFGSAGRKDQ